MVTSLLLVRDTPDARIPSSEEHRELYVRRLDVDIECH
jgi:hypothetical protein